ncbi:hypothetical protein F0Q32_11730 [Pseudocitrobacter sp. 73]|nr:hypothetical protein F0Q32_11730 [Pseudocitrobacter sp. 73]
MFYLLLVGERSPEQDKSAGSGFERCEATARRVAGRTPAINCQASNKQKAIRKDGLFALVRKNLPDGGCALSGLRVRSTLCRPGKRSATGQHSAHNLSLTTS